MRKISFSLSLLLFALVTCLLVACYNPNNSIVVEKQLSFLSSGPEEILIANLSSIDPNKMESFTANKLIETDDEHRFLQRLIIRENKEQFPAGEFGIRILSIENVRLGASTSILSLNGKFGNSSFILKQYKKGDAHKTFYAPSDNCFQIKHHRMSMHRFDQQNKYKYSISDFCIDNSEMSFSNY